MVEELGVDGRYAVEQGIARVRLDDGSQTAGGAVRVRWRGVHGRRDMGRGSSMIAGRHTVTQG